MHKLMIFPVILLLLAPVRAQNLELTVSGYVLTADGTPVEGVSIFLSVFFENSTFIFSETSTDASGSFEFVFIPPPLDVTGLLSLSMIDCNGDFVEQEIAWSIFHPLMQHDFVWCDIDISVDSCSVVIIPDYDPLHQQTTLYALVEPNIHATFIWSQGGVHQSIVVTEPGSYCVTITTDSGCTATACIDVDENGPVCHVMIATTGTGINGGLHAVAYGVPPFTYVWSTGETSQWIFPVEPGTYCVTITDHTGCEASACHTIDSLSCEAMIFENAHGGLSAHFSSGAPHLTYHWSTGETTQTIYPHADGEYCVTITNLAGCSATACIEYELPGQQCAVFLIYTGTNSGFHGALSAHVSVGHPPYTYLWSTGDTHASIQLDSLVPGICVTVTDATGCVDSVCTDDLLQSCTGWIAVEYTSAGAVLTAHLGGFNTAHGYHWSTGQTNPSITIHHGGMYCVTITTTNGCTFTTCADVDFHGEFDACQAYVIYTGDNSGTNQQFEVVAFGSPPYTYVWSTGDTTAVVLAPAVNATLCVTVTDATGCVTEACTVVFFPLCQISIDIAPHGPSAYVLTASGNAVVPFSTFSWSTGASSSHILIEESGTYCVTGISPDGCLTSACVYIDIEDGDTTHHTAIIQGHVYGLPNETLKGTVELYKVSHPATNTFPWKLVATTEIAAGNYYAFKEVEVGVYGIRAVVTASAPGDKYLPTYHISARHWMDANLVAVPHMLTVIQDIWLIATPPTTGAGVISGWLTDPDGLLPPEDFPVKSAGIADVQMILLSADGTPVNYDYTDPSGGFYFDQLPWGTYRLRFEVPGVHSPEIWVTLSPGRPGAFGIEINTADLSSSVDDLVPATLSVYPQPAAGMCYVTVDRHIAGRHTLYITGADGRIISQLSDVFAGETTFRLDIGDLPQGMYTLFLQDQEGLWVQKLLVQK